ncbi:MAG TPA: PilN domain-containing protein [Polyangiaceae bacterium]|jgi:type IV pilus assembly protein PilN|nr:PilN domain-containing protein [Polyangiaceae bacterium]
MIRINLIPQKRRAEQSEGSQLWLAVVMVLMLAQVAALFVFHGFKGEELKDQQRKNAELTSQIDQSRNAVANHEEVKAKLAQLRAREEAIGKLQSARTGPTAVLLELARLLTPGRGPSVDPDRLSRLRRDDPLAVFNPSWDARRLWLVKFVEDHRKLRLEGYAQDGEDVSELARRMNLSSYFADVRLLPAIRQLDTVTKLEVVSFALEAKVNY